MSVLRYLGNDQMCTWGGHMCYGCMWKHMGWTHVWGHMGWACAVCVEAHGVDTCATCACGGTHAGKREKRNKKSINEGAR